MNYINFSFIFFVAVNLLSCCSSFKNLWYEKPARGNLSAIVLVAEGTEELEAVTTIDLLRRAGIEVTVAGVEGPEAITCKYGVVLTPDTSLELAMQKGLSDLVVVPGGEAACNLMAQSDRVGQLLSEHAKSERFVAASTAGPIVLDAHKINFLKRLTSAPEFSDKLFKHYTYFNWEDTIVDVPGKMITTRFPGSILEFGLALINHVADRKTANEVSYGLLPYSEDGT